MVSPIGERGGRPSRQGRGGALRGLLLACHLGPTVVVTGLSVALAAGAGAGPGVALLLGSVVLAGQLSIGWSNDWIDAARDVAVHRGDKPVVQGLVSAVTLRRAAVAAAVVSVALAALAGPLPALAHGVVLAGGWAYNAGLKATVWSWVPYATSFGTLPAFLVLALPGHPRPALWAMAAGALLGVGAHIANVVPDLEDDAATGVRGLPHRLGRRVCSVAAPVALLAAVVVVVLGPSDGVGVARLSLAVVTGALAVMAGVVAVTRPESRLPFALTMAVAALCVTLLVASGPQLAAR